MKVPGSISGAGFERALQVGCFRDGLRTPGFASGSPTDGAVKDVDLSELLARGGVFTKIRDDRSTFEQVRVNPRSRTVEWPGEIDLDPVVLCGLAEPA